MPVSQQAVAIEFDQAHVFKTSKPLSKRKISHGYDHLFTEKPQVKKISEKTIKFKGLKILIADDNVTNLTLLTILLSDLNIDVTQANNGERSRRKISRSIL